MFDRIVASFPELAELAPEARDILEKNGQLRRLPAGSVLFSEGVRCEGYVLLLDGSVKVRKLSEDGRELVLYRVEAGESCIMTTTCLMSDEGYQAEGIAETDVVMALIPPNSFTRLLEISDPFRRFVFGVFSRRLSMLTMLVDEVVFKKLDKRLAQLLLDYADRKGHVLSLTHQHLAGELGSVREVVSRQLKQFERDGLVRLSRGVIEILDRDGLQAVTR
ncbi:Crp/Fnr family transcriptional regulator [Luteithermobacter gelatinilyticus]|uniref:Crp/Fnr family transcriptional regulator n=1 Tax=Luteithermobacter gelatinilyticus TaxID=2582913 RepID=UPI0011074F7C|nr:Crp/Fnr family transcriptional regulator [Luteithermobacter gelatinilyticus]